ncbi:sigma-70 family RNA polymerase sigma factor [Luteimonas salinilitoris]|uniref:Sigma-70 family RNA polymerase sigma factor n=1 Tax=Luteimonas salinilitoris TaxID=3237697 RepID=A0ABV4HPD4_9GAMM
MTDDDWLARQFEAHRGHLRAVAFRMLGSRSEADDVVQEAWLRLDRSDAGAIDNLGGWLTTVVARVCLDQLRARKSRREEPFDPQLADPDATHAEVQGPEHELLLTDAIGPALLIVLDTLTPAERLAFVLHDMFGMSFDDIAAIVDRTPTAARQLASRARRRVQGTDADADADRTRQREIVAAFLHASRNGDFDALLALLDPEVVLRADRAAVQASAAGQAAKAPKLTAEARGPGAIVETFLGRAQAAQPALIDGAAGAVYAPEGQPRVVFAFRFSGGKVAGIDVVADPARIGQLDVAILDG